VKKILLFSLFIMFFLLPTGLAQAKYEKRWSDPLPSPYPGRVNTHNQYVRIFLNDGGVMYNNYAIHGSYMPVFCLPGKLNSGYTAAVEKDLRENDPFAYAILKSTKFQIATAENIDYFLIHNGLRENPYIKATTMDTNVEIQNNPNAPVIGKLTPGPDDATTKDPYKLYNRPPNYSVAWVGKDGNDYEGFYYATTYLKGDKGGQVGSSLLTADAAKALVTHKGNVQVNTDVYINYNYNLALIGLKQKKVARNPGEEEKWTVQLINQTPFTTVKDKTHLRAFIQEKGGEPQLVASKEAELAQNQVASTLFWEFGYALPENDFTLIVTVNRNYIDGKWVNEPLVTQADFQLKGEYYKIYGKDGAMETTYSDNVLTSEMTGGNSGSNEPPSGDVDLAAMDLNLYNSAGSRMADALIEGETYKVAAVFRSYYNKPGFAELRFYVKQSAGNYQLRDSKFVFMEPGGTVYIDKDDGWVYTASKGTTPVIAINRIWENGWKDRQFKLESGELLDESNYDNNTLEKSHNITENTTPREESHYASYYPAMEVQEPIYETIKEKVWLPEVKKLPYKEAEVNVKVRARLVPNEDVSRSLPVERPSWHTLTDGTEVFGYWVFPKNSPQVLVECDQQGNKTGWAYLNEGKFVEQERQVLIGYETKRVQDPSQPKRYLYPAEVYPSPRYMNESLSHYKWGTREPKQVYYPFGDYLNREEWRQIIIPIYNPNDWAVKAKVRTFIPESRDVFVNLGAKETKWVMVKLPQDAKVKGWKPYKINYLSVVVHIEENYDPYAPDEYKYQPPADDYDRVFYFCDATGLQFGAPQWYKENEDDQEVFVLKPAFKTVMKWVPDDPEDWTIGKPVYETVPGYTWSRVEVYRPIAIDDRSPGKPASEQDISNMRAVGPMVFCKVWLANSIDEFKGMLSNTSNYRIFIANYEGRIRRYLDQYYEDQFTNRELIQYFNNPYDKAGRTININGQRYYYDSVTQKDGTEKYIFMLPHSGYSKIDGFTIKHIGERVEETKEKYTEKLLYRFIDTYKVNQGFLNNSQFIMNCKDLQVVYRHETADSDYARLPVKWDVILQPGETKYLPGEFETAIIKEKRSHGSGYRTIRDSGFEPDISYGSIYDGIATLDTVTAYGNVSINAPAGVENYNDEDKWDREFKPALNKNVFDFCEVMTVDELLAFGDAEGGQIKTNLNYFVSGTPEQMKVSADVNIGKWLKRRRD